VGLKSDREFLRNISIGAVGTKRVAEILTAGGFQIMELERYSSSNKIWSTKIKRLRVPDLLCLRTGLRIESRGKSTLKITMSHAVNNPDRAWDKGLRDDDLVAFIQCQPQNDFWVASSTLALFRVGDMRSTSGLAGLSQMKAASEGSEIRLTWPATIPSSPGIVQDVTDDAIVTQLDSGRRQTYCLTRKGIDSPFTPYVRPGDRFGPGDTVIASVLPSIINPILPNLPQYDFVSDLVSPERETVYAAAKALGFLPAMRNQSGPALVDLVQSHENALLQLEAAAALARLGDETGRDHLERVCRDHTANSEVRMETALILAELSAPRSVELLKNLLRDTDNPSELRAAAAWGLSIVAADLELSSLVPFMSDDDELTAAHAIAGATRLIDETGLDAALSAIGNDDVISAGVVKAVLSAKVDPTRKVIEAIERSDGKRRNWLLYLLASRGRERCGRVIRAEAPELIEQLEFFCNYHTDNWTNRLDVADQIDFLLEQILD
jgi:hypothetical protein